MDGKPIGFGFEPTFEEWLHNQVHIVGAGMKRVLRDDGVLWVMMDDLDRAAAGGLCDPDLQP